MSPALPTRTIQRLRTAVADLKLATHDPLRNRELDHLITDLDRALRGRRGSAQRRKEKRKELTEAIAATSEVRRMVMLRAAGQCEARAIRGGLHTFRCRTQGSEFDHFFGRARSESVETCWFLCTACHRLKTENKPSSAWWLEAFLSHAELYGYTDAAERAKARLNFVQVRKAVGR